MAVGRRGLSCLSPGSPCAHCPWSRQLCSEMLRPPGGRPRPQPTLASFKRRPCPLSVTSADSRCLGRAHALRLDTEVPAGSPVPSPLLHLATAGHRTSRPCLRPAPRTSLPRDVGSALQPQFSCHFLQEASPDCWREIGPPHPPAMAERGLRAQATPAFPPCTPCACVKRPLCSRCSEARRAGWGAAPPSRLHRGADAT